MGSSIILFDTKPFMVVKIYLNGGVNIKTFWCCVTWKRNSNVLKNRITLLKELWIKL
jgi:hypothetical protein